MNVQQVKFEDETVTISIGLMNFDLRSMMLKPLWGKRFGNSVRIYLEHHIFPATPYIYIYFINPQRQ